MMLDQAQSAATNPSLEQPSQYVNLGMRNQKEYLNYPYPRAVEIMGASMATFTNHTAIQI